MRPGLLRLPVVLLTLLIATLLTACENGFIGTGERGSGNMVTETRDVGSFTAIDVRSALNLDLIVDPSATPSVVVTFDDNLIDMVVTRISGSTLVLDIAGSVNLTGSADRSIAVTMNELLSLEASGASDVDATGTTDSYELDASGASSVDVRDLTATDVELDVSGASSVDLYATGTVRGSASGASNLDIYGNPTSVLVDSSGASSVDIKD
ncbi:MAG: DUF2807 domain-containing protein [Acidimicrobiia bacterium]|nr:DUF2807 domain-containing protein [Acidimicrobiia bacterium]